MDKTYLVIGHINKKITTLLSSVLILEWLDRILRQELVTAS